MKRNFYFTRLIASSNHLYRFRHTCLILEFLVELYEKQFKTQVWQTFVDFRKTYVHNVYYTVVYKIKSVKLNNKLIFIAKNEIYSHFGNYMFVSIVSKINKMKINLVFRHQISAQITINSRIICVLFSSTIAIMHIYIH